MSYQEFRPSRFGNIPVVTKNIIIINVILFAAKFLLLDKIPLDDYLDLHYFKSSLFKPHQIITHMFMHADIGHIFFNMFGVYMFGSILENVWGSKRFINFYLLTGLGSAIAQMTVFYFEEQNIFSGVDLSVYSLESVLDAKKQFYDGLVCLGASGAVFGLLTAFGMMFPNTQLQIYFLFPMKAKYFVLLYAAAELYMGLSSLPGDNIAHFAHLGGAAVGAIIVLLWKKNRNFFF